MLLLPTTLRRQLRSAAMAADRPRANALRVQHILGHPDLLFTAGAVGGTRAAVGVPSARGELQATREAVTGADPPVSARLALRNGVPVHAVRPDRRRRRSVGSRRRRCVRCRWRRCVRCRWRRSVRCRWRRSVRSRGWWRRIWGRRRGSNVRVKAHRLRVSGGGRHGKERPGNRGQHERLADVIQSVPFACARAKANPPGWVDLLSRADRGALARAVSFGHDKRRARSARAAYSRWLVRSSPLTAPLTRGFVD
jgi:hypothetical protein